MQSWPTTTPTLGRIHNFCLCFDDVERKKRFLKLLFRAFFASGEQKIAFFLTELAGVYTYLSDLKSQEMLSPCGKRKRRQKMEKEDKVIVHCSDVDKSKSGSSPVHPDPWCNSKI